MSRTRISGSASLWVGWRVLRLSECRTLLLPCRTLVRTGYSTIRPGYCRSNSAHGFPAAQTHPTLALQAQLSPLQQLATQHRCPSVQQSWCPHSNPLVWTASRGASSTPASRKPEAAEAAVSSNDEAKAPDSFGVRLLKLVGWMGGFYSRKAVLLRSAKTLYENCADSLKYEEFFELCSLPDTFQSWFLITHLHVWMLLVRLKREGEEGSYLIKELTATFWYDVESRMRVMGVHSSRVAVTSLRELLHQFYGLTLAYEEGLLSSDKVLASAIWRNMVFDKPRDTDPVRLAKMVEYVRKQIKHMDQLDSKELLEKGSLTLLALHEPYREDGGRSHEEGEREKEGEGGEEVEESKVTQQGSAT